MSDHKTLRSRVKAAFEEREAELKLDHGNGNGGNHAAGNGDGPPDDDDDEGVDELLVAALSFHATGSFDPLSIKESVEMTLDYLESKALADLHKHLLQELREWGHDVEDDSAIALTPTGGFFELEPDDDDDDYDDDDDAIDDDDDDDDAADDDDDGKAPTAKETVAALKELFEGDDDLTVDDVAASLRPRVSGQSVRLWLKGRGISETSLASLRDYVFGDRSNGSGRRRRGRRSSRRRRG